MVIIIRSIKLPQVRSLTLARSLGPSHSRLQIIITHTNNNGDFALLCLLILNSVNKTLCLICCFLSVSTPTLLIFHDWPSTQSARRRQQRRIINRVNAFLARFLAFVSPLASNFKISFRASILRNECPFYFNFTLRKQKKNETELIQSSHC